MIHNRFVASSHIKRRDSAICTQTQRNQTICAKVRIFALLRKLAQLMRKPTETVCANFGFCGNWPQTMRTGCAFPLRCFCDLVESTCAWLRKLLRILCAQLAQTCGNRRTTPYTCLTAVVPVVSVTRSVGAGAGASSTSAKYINEVQTRTIPRGQRT